MSASRNKPSAAQRVTDIVLIAIMILSVLGILGILDTPLWLSALFIATIAGVIALDRRYS